MIGLVILLVLILLVRGVGCERLGWGAGYE